MRFHLTRWEPKPPKDHVCRRPRFGRVDRRVYRCRCGRRWMFRRRLNTRGHWSTWKYDEWWTPAADLTIPSMEDE